MNDSKLLQGLVIGACVFLAFAILMTWADVLRYREAADLGPIPQVPTLSSLVEAAPAETAEPAETAQPTEPAPAPAPAEAQPGAAAELLKFAPEGTWGVVEMDLDQLMQSQVVKQLQAQQPSAPMSDMTQLAQAQTVFLLPSPGEAPDAPPAGWCALVKMAPGSREQLEGLLAQRGQQATVAGMEGYRISGGGGMMGGGGPMGGGMMGSQQAVVAFADDTTLLAAGAEPSLQAIAEAYQSGAGAGVSDAVQELLDLYSGNAIRMAFAPPEEMLQQVAQAEQTPEALKQMTSGAMGLNLDDKIRIKANLRMASEQAAGQLADQANATLDQQKQQMQQQAEQNPQMAMMIQPALGIFDKLSLSAEGDDVNVTLDMTPQELQSAMQMAMMAAMSTMMSGPGGPGGGFGGPPSPGGFGQ